MFSGRPPGGYIVNINIVIILANITHVLICGTVYDNVFHYISVPSLMLIMHGLTPISYTLYFRLYQYFVLPIKGLGISTRSEVTCSEHNKSQSRIYPNMCAKFGCGPTVVSNKKGGGYKQTDRQTDKGTLQLYIVDSHKYWSNDIKYMQ